MKVDVLLVNPGSRSSVYQGLGDDFSAIEPPSLAAMFATYLRRRGQSVDIIDAPAMNWSPEQVAQHVAEHYQPELIVLVVYGFQPSASTQNMGAAGDTARAIKQLMPHVKIMMTGTHPAALPLRTLDEESVDIVCDGEGPHAISVTAEYCKWHSKVGPLVATGINVEDLDGEMPGAAWDLLPMSNYRAHNWHCFENINERQPYASIHTTLGCPYKCSFCCINAPFGGPSYRMWSPASVGNELDILVNSYGVRNVKFVDEMFVLNRNHVLGVCDEIDRRGLGDLLNIWAYARVDTVKDEYLDRLRNAGFRWLALGIESASKHVRDGVEKGRFGSEEIVRTVRKVQSAGINVIGNYIFGLPDDTLVTMQETLDLALEAKCEFANFYSAMAYPGSKLYPMAIERGWKLPDQWIGYSQHSYETEPLPTETLTGAEVLRFRDHAFKTYFTDPHYLAMIRTRFGDAVVDHIARMVAQPLPRKMLE